MAVIERRRSPRGVSRSFYFINCMGVTVHTPLFREVFWHEYAKIPRGACKNPISKGDFYWIFACNCEGTEQLLRLLQKYIGGKKDGLYFL